MARNKEAIKEAWLEDALGQKYIQLISLCAFMGLGIWMMIDPSAGKHSGYERSTVYLVKEIWSLNVGIAITAISVFFIIKTWSKIQLMKSFAWVRVDSGYYMVKNKVRISGCQSLYDGNDLIVFHPAENSVYRFPKYAKTKLNKYRKVEIDDRFNCMDAYWTADQDGYFLYYKGVRVHNLTSEYRGDDLIATSAELGKKFRLPNYKTSLDNKIRSASIY